MRKTTEQFIAELEKVNPNILVVGEYITNKTKIELSCRACRKTWCARPIDLLRGCGCPGCAVNSRRKKHSDFVKELGEINPNIEILSEYKNNRTNVKCRCRIDGHIWFASPSNLLYGHGCPKCTKKYNRSHDEFVKEIAEINENLEILSEFINMSTKVKCRCKVDGHTWNVSPSSLLRGSGCKICNESKGEKRISSFLKSHNVNFQPQKSFDGLVGLKGRPLSYDFYIPDMNLLIEFQGEFHDGNLRGKQQHKYHNLAVQQEHDSRKRRYAEENNIKLLEIWYWDFGNIESILQSQLF